MSQPGTRAARLPSPKGASGATPAAEGCARARHAGEGEAADPGPAATWRRGGGPDAGQRPADDDPTGDRGQASPRAPSSTPTSTTSTPACRTGATGTRPSATAGASMT